MFTINHDTNILITGGSGFVGSHLTELLLEKGHTNLHITSTRPLDVAGVTVHTVDLTNAQTTHALFQSIQPQAVFHLASLADVGNSFENQTQVYHDNGAIQLNVLEAIRLTAPLARVVSISSAQVYGKSVDDSELPISEGHPFRPVNPYAVSKVHQDMLSYMYTAAYNLDIIRVRPFNHVGERQSDQFVLSSLAKQVSLIEKGEQDTLHVGNTDSIRDFSDVKDVVRAYYLLLEKGVSGEAYNVGSGHGVSINEVINLFTEIAKKKIIVQVDEARLRPSDIPVMIANIDKIKELGWQPEHTLESTILRILENWRTAI